MPYDLAKRLLILLLVGAFSFCEVAIVHAFTKSVIQRYHVSRSRTTNLYYAQSVKNTHHHPFRYKEEVVLEIDSLTNLGMGVGRIALDDKMNTTWVVFVPYTIPGEIVKVQIQHNAKSYSEASLVEIISSSESRIHDAPCPHFGSCGGCQYQHMTIEKQREWKTNQVRDAMERIGGFSVTHLEDEGALGCPRIEHTLGTNEIYKYRSKLTPRYSSGLEIGFQSNNNGPLVDVLSCSLATDAINEEYSKLRLGLQKYASRSGQQTNKELLFRETSDGTVVTDPKEFVTTSVANGLKLSFRAGNFFQINPYMLDKMISLALQAATPGMTHFIDCYCGSGLFALAAAATGVFDSCVGIEINKGAIEEAKSNAVQNELQHKCTFIAASASNIFKNKKVKQFPRDNTVVMIDPPRKGCSADFLQQLCEDFQPKRILYLSCNVATQARDAKVIIADYKRYRITSIQPLDLFPQTRHIECLMIFEKM